MSGLQPEGVDAYVGLIQEQPAPSPTDMWMWQMGWNGSMVTKSLTDGWGMGQPDDGGDGEQNMDEWRAVLSTTSAHLKDESVDRPALCQHRTGWELFLLYLAKLLIAVTHQ